MNDFLAGIFAGCVQALTCHPLDTMKTLIQANKPIQFNPRFLYRGLTVPLASNGLISSATFGVYYSSKESGVSFGNSCLLAGVTAGLVCNPVELYKIRLQIPNSLPYNPTRGLFWTLLRETPSMYFYYSAYEYCEEMNCHPAVGGGIAGTCSWLTMFHIDVIKTRIQSGVASTAREAIQQGHMNRGLGYCLARAIPHNAIGFWAFHWAKDQFKLREHS